MSRSSSTALSPPPPRERSPFDATDPAITFVDYKDERDIDDIVRLVSKDLSEPYSIFTYRYFVHRFPTLTIFAKHGDEIMGVVVCKADMESNVYKAYIGMLAVDTKYRGKGVGSALVMRVLERMRDMGCEEATLETEASNLGALALYDRLGFMRCERLGRYYLNAGDAYKLRLPLK